MGKLEAGMSDSLQEIYTKILKKAVLKVSTFKVDDIDTTKLV